MASNLRSTGSTGLALLTIASAGYLVLFENALYARETEYILVTTFLNHCDRARKSQRTTGWFMPISHTRPITSCTGALYWWGVHIPGLSLETVMYRSYFTSEGMFGLTANISSTFVFMFIIFGAFLLKSGAGDFIVRLANYLMGCRRWCRPGLGRGFGLMGS